MCASHGYECAESPYNAQEFVAENLNSFSVSFMLIDKEKNSIFLVMS